MSQVGSDPTRGQAALPSVVQSFAAGGRIGEQRNRKGCAIDVIDNQDEKLMFTLHRSVLCRGEFRIRHTSKASPENGGVEVRHKARPDFISFHAHAEVSRGTADAWGIKRPPTPTPF